MKTTSPPSRPSYLRLVEPALLMLMMRLAISVISLRRLCTLLGVATGASESVPNTGCDETVTMVRGCMLIMARNYPALGDCIPQSMAAAAMLRMRGVRSRLHFGVLKRPTAGEPLHAHAWLTVNEAVVAGDGMHRAFFELSSSGSRSQHQNTSQGLTRE